MVAYTIDAAAVLAVLQDTEADLAPLASLASDLQASVETVTSSLASSPVGRALTNYAGETLFFDLGSAVAGSGRAVQSVKAAVAEYAAADHEMRVRAEAAAAAVPAAAGPGIIGRPLPAGRPGVVPDPLPRVEPDEGSAGVPAASAVPPAGAAPVPPPAKEPERGSIVPLPGPPPWKPIWPRKPQPVLPNPLLRLPYRWMQPPWWQRPPWWMGPPRRMQPPWFPGLPRWPHGPGIHRPPWLWEFWPTPGCPGPQRWPGGGFLPPPDCYYPLLPSEIPLLNPDLPVARMLAGHQSVPHAQVPPEAAAGPDGRKWGLT